jgi:hypothetical protein
MGRTAVKRRWAETWDWPLVAIMILFLSLVVFFTADLSLPNPFPHH